MSYIGKTASSATQNIFKFVPSSSATTISGADAFGRVLSMPSNQDAVSVFLNGILLLGRGVDYSLSTSTVTFTSAYAISDEIIIITLEPFAVADMVKASTGGTFEGGTTHNGGITSTTGTFSGDIVFGGNVSGLDVNGTEVILDADGDTSITADTDDQIDFKVGGTDKMTLTSAGNLQLDSAGDFAGTDDTLQLGGSQQFKIFHNGGGGNSVACILSTANSMQVFTDVIRFSSADNSESLFGADKDGAFFAKHDNVTALATTDGGITTFGTNDIIKTNGHLKISNTFAFHGSTDNYSNVDGQQFHELNSGVGNEFILMLKNTNTSTTQQGLYIDHASGNTDNTSSRFINCVNTASRFQVLGDGDVVNHDNSYGSISDERIKQDITDAKSQWNDIKAIKIRNYKKKDDVRDYGDKAWTQIGVIAQELETVSPYLVKENDPNKNDILSSSEFGTLYTSDDAETKPILYEKGDDIPEGSKIGDVKTPPSKVVGDIKEVKEQVKSIKYSVLYMKAIKALQEAMARIETLEAKVKALEEA